MSTAPGPVASQSGTCEPPKCPPRAHSRRLRGPPCARENGAGGPAGHDRDMCQESSHQTMRSRSVIGPAVNGALAKLMTPICTHSRPSVLTAVLWPDGAAVSLASPSPPSARPARSAGMSCTISPVSGFHTRCGARPRCSACFAADRADTRRGSVSSVSQTARGAPPRGSPPSALAQRRAALGIHASPTAAPFARRSRPRRFRGSFLATSGQGVSP